MLSRKYYKVFAEILKVSETKEDIESRMIDFFIRDNPRFDIGRFAIASTKKE